MTTKKRHSSTLPNPNAPRNARRRAQRAEKAAQNRKALNRYIILRELESHLSGETLGRSATWLAERIDVMGWFIIDLDDGVRYVEPTKVAALRTAETTYCDGKPQITKHRAECYEVNSNKRSESAFGQTWHVGTWQGLLPDGWGWALRQWLAEQIEGAEAPDQEPEMGRVYIRLDLPSDLTAQERYALHLPVRIANQFPGSWRCEASGYVYSLSLREWRAENATFFDQLMDEGVIVAWETLTSEEVAREVFHV